MDEQLEEYDITVLNCLLLILQKITAEVSVLDSTEDNSDHLLSLVSASNEIITQINKIKYGYIEYEEDSQFI